MNKYIVLLRGINVGGNNIIKMEELRSLITEAGFNNVKTYIQSGNIVFESDINDTKSINKKVSNILFKKLNKEITTLVLTKKELDSVINEAPKGFGTAPDKYRYDVIYTIDPISPKDIVDHIETKDGVDKVTYGSKALYFSRLIARATHSKLSQIIKQSFYKNLTIRNWNTTKKLLSLIHEGEEHLHEH